MGSWRVRCGVSVPLLLPNFGPEHRPPARCSARSRLAVAAEAAPRANESIQRTDSGTNAPNGLVGLAITGRELPMKWRAQGDDLRSFLRDLSNLFYFNWESLDLGPAEKVPV